MNANCTLCPHRGFCSDDERAYMSDNPDLGDCSEYDPEYNREGNAVDGELEF